MNRLILNYLNKIEYSDEVNSILVYSFLKHKKIKHINNKFILNILQKANKEKSEFFLSILEKSKTKLCFEELLKLFEFVISPSDKLVNGAIYTPKHIREYITDEAFKNLDRVSTEEIKVADIACGCGGFLIDASKKIKQLTDKTYKDIFRENIYGVDIQQYSIERTEILLSLLAISEGEDEEYFDFNIHQGDSLKYEWKNKFDLILGNPPYVCSRNMDNKTKESIKKLDVCKTGHPDLYIPFFQIGYELLTDNGILGYITVNSFIASVNGRAIREYFEKKQVKLTIIDFGDEQIFNGRMTYTCLSFLQKSSSNYIYYTQIESKKLSSIDKLKFNEEKYIELNSFKGWSLKNNGLIQKIESRGKPLGDIFDIKNGIATLKNSVYIFKPIKEDNKYFYLEKNILIEKEICKNIVNSNRFNKDVNIDKLIEKIIFPYRHDINGKAILIEEKEFKKSYPKAYNYLLSNKKLLSTRDKGKGKYPIWYAFGRSQSLEKRKEKLFFPQLIKKGFKTYYNEDENLYFYNGMCAFASKKKLLQLQKIMASKEFWNYIEAKAKHYTSGYYGLGKNYLKDFGIIDFNI